MPEHTFTEGQRVYHRQLKRFGTFVMRDDLDRASSHVEFDDDPDGLDSRRITTAQLVLAGEAEVSC